MSQDPAGSVPLSFASAQGRAGRVEACYRSQFEDKGDDAGDADRRAAQKGGLESPAPRGIGGGFQEQRMTADRVRRFNAAIRRNHDLDNNLSLQPDLPRNCRVFWYLSLDGFSLQNALGDCCRRVIPWGVGGPSRGPWRRRG